MTYLYFMFSGTDACKIGISDIPDVRVTDLQTGNPEELHILGIIECETREIAIRMETAFHNFYAEAWIRDEWFELSPGRVISDINLIQSLPSFQWNQVQSEMLILNSGRVTKTAKRQLVYTYLVSTEGAMDMSLNALVKSIMDTHGVEVSRSFVGNIKGEIMKGRGQDETSGN